MGSSHAEPMLRNDVGEWRAPGQGFDYSTNAEGVADYWRERVATNARYESVWTLGMRGVHDSGIVGAGTMEDRKALMTRILADQRAMLTEAGIAAAPQVFTPYKEMLDIHRAGLAVPDDVTLMWPDDNFGYIRRLPQPGERARGGGHGVYYHLSYLGAPLSYLWLSITPPALIAEEMGRAYDLGADRMWIANVGDLKPAELATDYFLSLAWDVEGTRAQGVDGFVRRWAAENVAPALASEIAGVVAEHHRLNFQRRPEHLQWWLPGQKPRASALTAAETAERRNAFDALRGRAMALAAQVPPTRRDAFFELIAYPVESAALANERLFAAEAHDRLRDRDLPAALDEARRAHAADARIAALMHRYNHALAGGKWRGMMAVEPADGQWKSFRALPPVLPAHPGGEAPPRKPERATDHRIVVEAEDARGDWRRVSGLGRNGALLASRSGRTVTGALPVTLSPGRWSASIELLPTYPDRDGAPLALTLTIDGRAKPITIERSTGDPAWANAVLDNRIVAPVPGWVNGGDHRFVLTASGGGVLVDRLVFEPAKRHSNDHP